MSATQQLKSPFPWFGGKSKVADLVWARFGNVVNYVEPFAGSLAVLLARERVIGSETVNDKDAFLSNFWRAVQFAPESTAQWADWPVSEPDLHARHSWLIAQSATLADRIMGDPYFFDPKIAGWWVWGLCSWIGSGWCSGGGPWITQDGRLLDSRQLPHLGDAGRGINRRLPHLGDAGRGINRQLPHLGNAGQGINRQLPHLGNAGQGIFSILSNRLRRVRVACGDWSRVLGESVTVKHGITAVFLDPPYSDDANSITYCANDNCAESVRAWALSNGDNPLLRIALCGYEGEHTMPDSWECVAWKTIGGYGSQSDKQGRANSARERIWFSPACCRMSEDLFSL